MAVHRKHHAFTDEEGDPHSPKLEGFWNVQLGNVYYYMREMKNTDVVERYARDIKEGWWDTHVFNRGLLGLVRRHRAALRIVGRHRRLVGAARGRHSRGDVRVRALVVDQRPLPPRRLQELRQHRHQHPLLALLTGGEGLHNNHHGYPRSPKFSFTRERDRSGVAADQAADRAEAREAVQDDRRSRSVAALHAAS